MSQQVLSGARKIAAPRDSDGWPSASAYSDVVRKKGLSLKKSVPIQ